MLVLLDFGDGNGRVQQLLAGRGIGFAPDAEFLTLIEGQGANKALLNALKRAKSASAEAPADAVSYPQFVSCLQAAQHRALPKAEEACRATIATDPALGNFALGEVFLEEDKFADATAAFRSALRVDPKFADGHNYLGVALQGEGDTKGALKEYQAAVHVDPDYSTPHSNLADVYLNGNDPSRGLAEAHKTVALDPSNPSAHNNLAGALMLWGNLDGALAELKKALALDSKDAMRHANLARLLEMKRDIPDAVAELKQAAALDPTNDAWPIQLCKLYFSKAEPHGAAWRPKR